MKRHLPFAAFAAFALLATLAPAFAAAPAECAADSRAAAVDPAAAAGLDELFSPLAGAEEKVCIYLCEPWFDTATYWGIGADCTASRNDLTSQVSAEASSTGPGLCDAAGAISYCGYNLVITAACHWDWGHLAYVTDGYGRIKCKDWC